MSKSSTRNVAAPRASAPRGTAAPKIAIRARRGDPTASAARSTKPRPHENGTGRGLSAEGPLIVRVDDLEEFAAPPLHAKVHPPGEMANASYTIDDEARSQHHHPNDSGVVEFDADPNAADAAADLARDLGAQFLEGATYAEDVSERAMEDTDADDAELPFVVDDELGVTAQAPARRRRYDRR